MASGGQSVTETFDAVVAVGDAEFDWYRSSETSAAGGRSIVEVELC